MGSEMCIRDSDKVMYLQTEFIPETFGVGFTDAAYRICAPINENNRDINLGACENFSDGFRLAQDPDRRLSVRPGGVLSEYARFGLDQPNDPFSVTQGVSPGAIPWSVIESEYPPERLYPDAAPVGGNFGNNILTQAV